LKSWGTTGVEINTGGFRITVATAVGVGVEVGLEVPEIGGLLKVAGRKEAVNPWLRVEI